MQNITILVAGPYTISTEGNSILCNGTSARTVLPLKGDRNRTGELVAMFVETGCKGANGNRDIVGLSADQWQVHLDAVKAARTQEAAAYWSSPAGIAEKARRAAEHAYDERMNEGGEGYNPHRSGSEPSYRRSTPQHRYSPEEA